MITPRLAEEIDELCLVVIICQELLPIRRFLRACPRYNELLTTAPSLTFHGFDRIGSIHICAEHRICCRLHHAKNLVADQAEIRWYLLEVVEVGITIIDHKC